MEELSRDHPVGVVVCAAAAGDMNMNALVMDGACESETVLSRR